MNVIQKVAGIVIEGYKIASGLAERNPFGGSTIQMQVPLFLERGLDLSHCYPGTLNISIAPRTWRILATDPNYRGLKWHPGHSAEDFFIRTCRLCFSGICYDGWVYCPDPKKKLLHQHKPDTLEILAPPISGITYGDSVVLMLDPDEIRVE